MSVISKEVWNSFSVPLKKFLKKYPPETANTWSTKSDRINPFLPTRNPLNGVLRDPVYSNRRQADIYKEAKYHRLEHLIPQEMTWNKDSSRHILKGVLFPKGRIAERKREETLQNRQKKLSESMQKTEKFKKDRQKRNAQSEAPPL
ncbi:ribosomal protein subunit L25 [Schizosaccharomyces cryophilus OY26]|uniref:Ribosomal protein subunit L25 n=1 Tax=Schizosaccharomyces cryophilus (strain OY26 / ATCC MYA-4695 / CBS 11777 / NBRC 106824 / NRRL Y48691) TaxID=653667 RepID=S9X657_SCHCR|nr:ribosomal protein subunit L25 [Schizosaccharomyces cryophilus OY26]EPY52592.1 ribosomal protein subunit L25 [Schizosaccharomyces cryophilus OY26]